MKLEKIKRWFKPVKSKPIIVGENKTEVLIYQVINGKETFKWKKK